MACASRTARPGRTWAIALSWAHARVTTWFNFREHLEDVDEGFKVGDGVRDDVLLVFDDPLLSANAVGRLCGFETTRCMRLSGRGGNR